MSKTATFMFYFTAFLLISGLIMYSYVTIRADDVTIEEFINDSESFENVPVVIAGNLVNKSQDFFFITNNKILLKIAYPDAANVAPGLVEISGVYKAAGYIEARGVYTYRYNKYIYWVSAFAFIIFLIVLFNEWKLSWRGFEDA